MDCFQIEFQLNTLYKLEIPPSLTIYITQLKNKQIIATYPQQGRDNIFSTRARGVAAPIQLVHFNPVMADGWQDQVCRVGFYLYIWILSNQLLNFYITIVLNL